jgi:uncharacterized protein YfaS (alpha-2-macroglobulin family)
MADCGTITVEPAFDPEEVTATCRVGEEVAAVGDTISIPIEVFNNNPQTAEYSVDVLLNGTSVEQTSGTLRGNSRTSTGVSVELTSPGEIGVNIEVSAEEA